MRPTEKPAIDRVAADLRDMAENLWRVEYRLGVDEDAALLLEAADEIERLRTTLSAIVEEHDNNLYLQDYLDDELINRCRAALTPR